MEVENNKVKEDENLPFYTLSTPYTEKEHKRFNYLSSKIIIKKFYCFIGITGILLIIMGLLAKDNGLVALGVIYGLLFNAFLVGLTLVGEKAAFKNMLKVYGLLSYEFKFYDTYFIANCNGERSGGTNRIDYIMLKSITETPDDVAIMITKQAGYYLKKDNNFPTELSDIFRMNKKYKFYPKKGLVEKTK